MTASRSWAMLLADESSSAWAGWFLDAALLWCLVAAVVYEVGRRRIRARHPRSPMIARDRVLWFWVGIALLVAVLSPPVDGAADDLFSVHMSQHLVLGLLAPLAFVVARPLRVMSHIAPPATQRMLWRTSHRALSGAERGAVPVALALITAHVVVFSVWHVPALYDLAVDYDYVHLFEHATLFVTGLGLWWVLVAVRWQARSGLAVLYLFVVGLPMGALGALLTLAPEPIYAAHLATTASWGLTPLEDQQLAGGIMWVPGGIIYLAAASVLFIRWLAAGPPAGQETLRWDV